MAGIRRADTRLAFGAVAGVRRVDTRVALGAICLFVVVLGIWNAANYPPGNGYDAPDHISYATGLVPGGHLPPKGTGEYYTPPGYYALAGSAVWVAEKLGLDVTTALRAAMALNSLLLAGTVLLTFAIASELWPGRTRLALGASAFVALLPVVVLSEAMFHPETLSLFCSTLALWLCVRTFANPRYAFGLGAALGLAQLVRASALWTVGCVLVALLAGRRWRSLVVVCLLAALIPSPWYAYQEVTYGGLPAFPRPPTPAAHTATGAVKPIYDRRSLAFYLDPGLPQVLSAPYRPNFTNLLIPTTYAGVWGDYFGAWVWVARPHGPFKTTRVYPPPTSVERRLAGQSLIGLVPTLLALVGWLLVLRASLRRPPALAVALLPLLALLAYLYFTVSYPTFDGDVIKASYMLTTAPGWAIGFGYAIDRLRGGTWRLAAALLVLCALVDLTFIVYP